MKKLIFAVLAIVFAFTTVNAQAPKDGPRDGGDRLKARLEKLKTELQLTDEQTKKVEALFEEQGKAMKEMRDSGQFDRDKMREIRKVQEDKMKEILTPEQFAKLTEMNKNDREKMRRDRPAPEENK